MTRMLLLTVGLIFFAGVADAADPARVLFVTQSAGFKHGVVDREKAGGQLAPAEVALKQLGQQSGLFTVDATQDVASDFTRENLQRYDIVAFYTTGDLPIAEADLSYFLNDWLRQDGRGVLGFHSAMDTFHNTPAFWDMIGGTFVGHAWNARDTVHLSVHDADHPLAAPFAKAAGDDGHFEIRDEIYQYRHFQPHAVRVLMSLDVAATPTPNGVNTYYMHHVPVAWVRDYGRGKVYCNNLGHNPGTWTNRAFLDSIAAAVRWMSGEVEATAAPNPEVSAAEELKAADAFERGVSPEAPQFKG